MPFTSSCGHRDTLIEAYIRDKFIGEYTRYSVVVANKAGCSLRCKTLKLVSNQM